MRDHEDDTLDELVTQDEEDEYRPFQIEERQPAAGRRRRRQQRRKLRSGDWFLAFLVFIIALIFIAFNPKDVLLTVYSREAGVILIIMIIEYLVLKSMDRTRVYKLENTRLREQRRADRQRLRRAKELLDDARTVEGESPDVKWKARAEVLSDEISKNL